MPDVESDGIGEALEGHLQAMLTAATGLAQQLVANHTQRRADAARQSATAAQEVERRLDAERHAMWLAVQPVYTDQWWATATPERIRDVYGLAAAWPDDPTMAAVRQHMATELKARYGLDVATLPAAALADAVAARVAAAGPNVPAPDPVASLAAADALSMETAADVPVDLTGVASPAAAEPVAWDSPQRRAQSAQRLRDAGLPENLIVARMAADVVAEPASAIPATVRTTPQPRRRRRTPDLGRQLMQHR